MTNLIKELEGKTTLVGTYFAKIELNVVMCLRNDLNYQIFGQILI